MQFRALTDLYLSDGRYIQAGTIFTPPSGFIPPVNAVDPADPDAVSAYWNAGPAGCFDAEWRRALFTNGQRWSDIAVAKAGTQWVPNDVKNPGQGFVLSGSGNNLGVHPIV